MVTGRHQARRGIENSIKTHYFGSMEIRRGQKRRNCLWKLLRVVSGDTAPSLRYREAVEHAPASEYPEGEDSAIAMLAYVARRMRFPTDETKWCHRLPKEDAAGVRSDLYDFCEKACSLYSQCHMDLCEGDATLEQFNETTAS